MKYSIFIISALIPTSGLSAMVVSDNANGGTHNITTVNAPLDISDIWARSGSMNGGSATYLGYYDNQYWALTANHVPNGNITFQSGTYSILNSYTLQNPPGFPNPITYSLNTDLKLLSIAGNNALQLLGSIGINMLQNITPTTDLYAIGTGISVSIGSAYNAGSRQKQWALFNPDQYTAAQVSGMGGYFFVEKLDTTNRYSFSAAYLDSGGGVFVNQNNTWLLAGIMNAIGDEDINTVISNGDITVMLDLSWYAPQINAIMNVPEPSTAALFLGIAAINLVLLSKRSRRTCRRN